MLGTENTRGCSKEWWLVEALSVPVLGRGCASFCLAARQPCSLEDAQSLHRTQPTCRECCCLHDLPSLACSSQSHHGRVSWGARLAWGRVWGSIKGRPSLPKTDLVLKGGQHWCRAHTAALGSSLCPLTSGCSQCRLLQLNVSFVYLLRRGLS